MTVHEVSAALGPLHEREPAHALRVQPAPELAGREVGRTEPVRQGELGRVLDAQTSLLGGVDQEEATEGTPGLATEARGRLGVEQDDPMAGCGELSGRDEPGKARRRQTAT